MEPLVIELERESESVCIVAHEAILRCVYAYLMQVPHSEVRAKPSFVQLRRTLSHRSLVAT